jgi:hypothetical protein
MKSGRMEWRLRFGHDSIEHSGSESSNSSYTRADIESIRVFIACVLVVLSSVLGGSAKSLHPVLSDRNEFILRAVTENFDDRRN